MTWPMLYRRGFFRVGLGLQASLLFFTSALAAFLVTADRNKSVTNQEGLNASFGFIKERRPI